MDEIRGSVDAQQLAELRRQYIGRQLQRAYRASAELAARKLNARGHTGLSLATTVALTQLDLEGTRISVLAERAGMTKQSMGQLVAELESLGYVTRSPDIADRRATLVQFTEAGWRFLLDAAAVKREIEAEYAALLGADRLDALRTMLEKMAAYPSRASE
jgi:DNA-binding MarR family transcriptional regulator